MIERLLILLAAVGGGILIWKLVTRSLARRAQDQAPHDALLIDAPTGTAGIVYFSTTTCAPCRFQQKPELARLATELGDRVHIVSVDATNDPEAASRWGVMSVPTTFVFDAQRKVRYVNRGVTTAVTLNQQLAEIF